MDSGGVTQRAIATSAARRGPLLVPRLVLLFAVVTAITHVSQAQVVPVRKCGPIVPDTASKKYGDHIDEESCGSAEACRSLCFGNPKCSAWDYRGDWAVPECWLYTYPSSGGVVPASQGRFSGSCSGSVPPPPPPSPPTPPPPPPSPPPPPVRACGPEQVGYLATNCDTCVIDSSTKTINQDACRDWCKGLYECTAWTYHNGWAVPQCFVFRKPSEATAKNKQGKSISGNCYNITSKATASALRSGTPFEDEREFFA